MSVEQETSPLIRKNLYLLLRKLPDSELHQYAATYGGEAARVANMILDERRAADRRGEGKS